MKGYYGDVDVVVKMRYRVSAEFETRTPTKGEMLKCLRDQTYDDITDSEQLEVLSVEKVGKNAEKEE